MKTPDLVRGSVQCSMSISSRRLARYGAALQASTSTSPYGGTNAYPHVLSMHLVALPLRRPALFHAAVRPAHVVHLVRILSRVDHAQVLQRCSSSLRPRAVLEVRYRDKQKKNGRKMGSRGPQDGPKVGLKSTLKGRPI